MYGAGHCPSIHPGIYPRIPVRRVVLVVLDGLRADAIDGCGLRSWRRLASEGAWSLAGTTIAPSVTAAAMASLLTGVPPTVHGVRSDRFHLPRASGPVEPLPRVLARAGLPTSGFVRALPLLFRGIGQRVVRHLGVGQASFRGRNATEILLAAVDTLARQRRGLVLMHWPDCDDAGHAHGWRSEPYARAAHRLDLALGMLAAMIEIGEDPDTLLVALADHGGGGVDPRDHESDHPDDRTIPLLVGGAAALAGELDAPTLLDVPATIAWALGVQPPASYAGRPLLEAFERGRQRRAAGA